MPEQYVTQERCDKFHGETDKKLELIYRGLFINNGKPCHQTLLDRHDRILGVLCWITSIACATLIVAAVTFAIKLVWHVGV